MRRVSVSLIIILAVLATTLPPGHLRAADCTIAWAVDADGFWDDSANWEPQRLPGATDTICLTRPTAEVTVTIRQHSGVFPGLQSSETLRLIDAAYLEVRGAATLDGGLLLEGGALYLGVGSTIGGASQWTGGTLGGTVGGHPTNRGTLTLAGASDKVLNGTLENAGTIVHAGSGALLFTGGGPGSLLINRAGAEYDFQVDGRMGVGGGTVANAGTVRKSGGTGEARIEAAFNNAAGGRVHVEEGKLILAGGGSSSGGTFTADTGAVLDLTGGAFPVYAGTYTGTGAGRIELTSGILYTAQPGQEPAVFDFAPGLFHWTGGTITGMLTNLGMLTLSGSDRALNGTIDNAGRIVHANNSALLFTGGGQGSFLINRAGAEYDFQADGRISGGTVVNAGTVRKSGGTGEARIEAAFNSAATGGVAIEAGRLVLAGGGTSTGGTFDVDAGAVLEVTSSSNYPVYTGTYTGTGAGRIELTSGILYTAQPGQEAVFDFAPGLFHWTGGTITGMLTNLGMLTLSGSDRALNGTIDNAGRIVHANNSALLFTGGGQGSFLINRAGAEYDFQADGRISGGTVVNAGTVRKSGGSGEALLEVGFNNTAAGTIEVASGRLNLVRGGTSSGGHFEVAAGALLEVSQVSAVSQFQMSGRYTGSGAGHFRASGILTGITEEGGAQLDFAPGFFQVAGGQLLGAFTNLGELTLTGEGDVYCRCSLTNKGTIHQRGTGAFQQRIDAVIINEGLYDLQSDADIVVVEPQYLGNSPFINTGILRKSGGIGLSELPDPTPSHVAVFSNTGTIEVRTGTLAIARNVLQVEGDVLTGGAWHVAEHSRLELQGSGAISENRGTVTLQGEAAQFPQMAELAVNAGTFAIADGLDFSTAGDLSNTGTLAAGVASTLAVHGAFTQSVSGTLKVEIGGRPASEGYGQLTATGEASLGGALEVGLADGFGPTIGDSYRVMGFAGHTGTFAQMRGLAPFFEAQLTTTALTLNTLVSGADLVLDPATIAVPAAGAPGQPVTIRFRVRNQSSTPAPGNWLDSVYLSADSRYSPDDPLIGRVEHQGGLEGLASYDATLTTALPGVTDGAYHVIVVVDSRGIIPDPARDNNIGASGATLQVEIPALQFGTLTSGTIRAGQDLYYRLDVPAGGDVRLAATFVAALQAELFVRADRLPERSTWDYAAANPYVLEREIVMASPRAGPYYILLHGREGAESGKSFELQATHIAFDLQDVTPGRGGNGGRVTTTLHGAGFSRAAAVSLVRTDGSGVADATVTFVSANQLFARFDLAGVAPGSYGVRLVDAAGTATLPSAFEVVAGVAGTLRTIVQMPPIARTGRMLIGYIDYINAGDTDLVAPLVLVDSLTASRMTFDLTADPQATELSFLATADEGPPGVLPPGAHGRVLLRVVHDFAGSRISTRIADASAADTMDWDALQASMRPDTAGADWNAVFDAQFRSQGTTIGDYARALANGATRLEARTGKRTRDVAELHSFIMLDGLAERQTTFAGHVYRGDTTHPLGGVTVAMTKTGTLETYVATSSADGLVRFRNVPAGTYRLHFEGMLPPPDLKPVTIQAGQVPASQTWVVSDGGRIVGRAVLAEGKFPEDATIEVIAVSSDGTPVVAEVDELGQFAITGLISDTYRVELSTAQSQRRVIDGVKVKTESTVELPVVVLGGAGTIRGTLRDAQTGQALAGVRVVAVDATTARSALTAEDGSFTLPGVPAGELAVSAYRKGYVRTETRVEVRAGRETSGVDLKLTPGARLSGTVTSGGTALTGVAVDLLVKDVVRASALTDASGRYTIEGPAAGTYTLRVRHAEYRMSSQNITLGVAEQRTVDVALEPVSLVRGDVRRAGGQVIPGLFMALRHPDGHTDYTQTNALGAFGFADLPAGDYVVMFADGSHRRTVHIDGPASRVDVQISLAAGAIQGSVRKSDGVTPELRATVALLRDNQAVFEVPVDVDGRYSFPLVSPGTYDIMVRSQEASYPRLRGIAVAANATVNAPVARPNSSERLAVRLVHAGTNQPLTVDGIVVLTRVDLPRGSEELQALVVDATGTATFERLVPGDYLVQAIHPGRASQQARLRVAAGETTHTFRMGAASTVRGIIRVPGLASAEGVRIVVYQRSAPALQWTTVAAANGSYEFGTLPAGTYDILVVDARNGLPHLATQRREGISIAEGGAVLEIFDLAGSTTSISGRVVDAGGSAPLAATVRALDANGLEVATAETDADGRYTLGGLAAGTFVVEARALGFAVRSRTATVAAGEALAGVDLEAVWAAGLQVQPGDDKGTALAISLGVVPAIDFIPSWLRNIIDSARTKLAELFGEPRDTRGVIGRINIPPNCEEAFALANRMYRMQRLKGDVFDAWHTRWDAAVDIISGALGEFGIKLFQIALALWAASGELPGSLQAIEADRVQVGQELLRAQNATEALPLMAQLEHLNDLYASMRATLAATGSATGGLSLNAGIPGLMDTILSIERWNSIDDLFALLDDANGLASYLLGLGGAILSVIDALRRGVTAFPALGSLIQNLSLVSDTYNAIRLAIRGISDVMDTFTELRELEQRYLRFSDERDRLYHQVLSAIARCEDDDDDDPQRPPHRPPGGRPGGSGGTATAFSSDPNEKVTTGVAAPGRAGRYNRPDFPIAYTIRFENLETANAPAQEVVITDQLPPELDRSTFELGAFGFGEHVFEVPAGRNYYRTRLDMRPEAEMFVEFEAGIDLSTGQVTWRFTSLDPATGDLVADPLAGFLPPNNASGRGEGFVTFSIRPRADLPDGTTIPNDARIIFDTNAPIDTAVVTNTLDLAPPVSSVNPLPATGPAAFTVRWSGEDAGAGIAFYDVYVAVDGGPFQLWQNGTSAASSVYTGALNHTYSFYSVATDYLGYRQATPTSAQATTRTSGQISVFLPVVIR